MFFTFNFLQVDLAGKLSTVCGNDGQYTSFRWKFNPDKFQKDGLFRMWQLSHVAPYIVGFEVQKHIGTNIGKVSVPLMVVLVRERIKQPLADTVWKEFYDTRASTLLEVRSVANVTPGSAALACLIGKR